MKTHKKRDTSAGHATKKILAIPDRALEAGARVSENDILISNSAPHSTKSGHRRDLPVTAMTDDPISLDGRRTAAERRRAEMRRRPANDRSQVAPSKQPHIGSLEDHMLTEPAQTCVEVMEKWRFLLHRYSATQEAGDDSIHKLIERAIADLELLRKREEHM